MSRMAAIDVALRHQLIADGHSVIDYKKTLADLGYTAENIQIFLLNLANRLRLDQPALRLNWRNLGAQECLTANMLVMVGQIESVLASEAVT